MSEVAIVLSGCGVFDGTEIHEVSAACAALSRAGKKQGKCSKLLRNIIKFGRYMSNNLRLLQ